MQTQQKIQQNISSLLINPKIKFLNPQKSMSSKTKNSLNKNENKPQSMEQFKKEKKSSKSKAKEIKNQSKYSSYQKQNLTARRQNISHQDGKDNFQTQRNSKQKTKKSQSKTKNQVSIPKANNSKKQSHHNKNKENQSLNKNQINDSKNKAQQLADGENSMQQSIVQESKIITQISASEPEIFVVPDIKTYLSNEQLKKMVQQEKEKVLKAHANQINQKMKQNQLANEKCIREIQDKYKKQQERRELTIHQLEEQIKKQQQLVADKEKQLKQLKQSHENEKVSIQKNNEEELKKRDLDLQQEKIKKQKQLKRKDQEIKRIQEEYDQKLKEKDQQIYQLKQDLEKIRKQSQKKVDKVSELMDPKSFVQAKAMVFNKFIESLDKMNFSTMSKILAREPNFKYFIVIGSRASGKSSLLNKCSQQLKCQVGIANENNVGEYKLAGRFKGDSSNVQIYETTIDQQQQFYNNEDLLKMISQVDMVFLCYCNSIKAIEPIIHILLCLKQTKNVKLIRTKSEQFEKYSKQKLQVDRKTLDDFLKKTRQTCMNKDLGTKNKIKILFHSSFQDEYYKDNENVKKLITCQ